MFRVVNGVQLTQWLDT